MTMVVSYRLLKQINCMMFVKLCVVMWISATLVQGLTDQGEMYKTCLETPCTCCKNGSCSIIGKCYGCIDGFTGPSCKEPCPDNCFNCAQTFYQSDTDKVCYNCNSGYYNGRYQDVGRYTFQQDCSLSCNTGCENCTSFNRCNRCKYGYFMSGEQCKRCPYNCDKCLSPDTCINCANGYYWNEQNCENCQPNCKICKSPTVCEECNADFFLKEGDCVSCPNGCLTCNTTSSCRNCQTQYYLDGNQCFACRENCVLCGFNKSQYVCNKCREGYYEFNQTCTKCVAGCVLCRSKNNCFACKTGFSLHNGTCYDNQYPDTTIEGIIASALTKNEISYVGRYVGIVIGGITATVLILLAVICFARNRKQVKRRCETENCERRCVGSITFNCFRQVYCSTPQQPTCDEDDESRLPLNKPDTNNIDTVDETTIANGIEENGQISRTPKEITSAQDHHTGLKHSTPGIRRPQKPTNVPPKPVTVETLKENFDGNSINFRQQFESILEDLKLESGVTDVLAVGKIIPIYITYNSKPWQSEHDAYMIYIASSETCLDNIENFVLEEIWARGITNVVMVRNGQYSQVTVEKTQIEQGNETKEIKLFDMSCPSENYCNQTTRDVITSAVMDLHKKITESSTDSKIPTLFNISVDNRYAFRIIGTYIVFDQLVKMAQETGYANVPLCVQMLLKQCPSLIQSSDQYEFIHSVLVQWIGRSKAP